MVGRVLRALERANLARDTLVIFTSDNVRSGAWKYLKEPNGEHLFDIVNDPGEKADLRGIRSDRFDALRSQHRAWAAQMLPLPSL